MCNLPIKLPIEKESFIVNIEKSLEKSTSEVILNPKIISIIPNIPFKKDLFEINSENILFYSSKDSRSPGKRHFKYIRLHRYIKKNYFLKSKVKFYKKKLGRNYKGRLVSYYKGGGFKILHREIDENRNPYIHRGIIEQFEYSPYNSSILARIYNPHLNYHFYVRAADGFKVGEPIFTYKRTINPGDASKIKNITIGQPIHNINLKNTNNIARSAGTFAIILQKYFNYSLIRFPSNKLYYVPSNSQATLGRVSNKKYHLINLAKAGRKRWYGLRPHVRGVAMNPIDHPHGGGQGKTSGGHSTSVSPWGKPTKQIKKKKLLYCAKNRKKIVLKKEIIY
jgi:large subunit ribosomal protein L2